MRRLVKGIVFRISAVLLIPSPVSWGATPCHSVHRTGAASDSVPPVAVSREVRNHLPKGAIVRGVLHTNLTAAGEQILFYDNDSWPFNPKPAIAVVAQEQASIVLFLNASEALYLESCEFHLTEKQKALAIAYQFAGDGSGTEFVVLAWQSGRYRAVLHRQVSQGRLVLANGELELWDSVGTGECVWCPQPYTVARYRWRNGGYVEVSRTRKPKSYDPEEISGSPLVSADGTQESGQRNTR